MGQAISEKVSHAFAPLFEPGSASAIRSGALGAAGAMAVFVPIAFFIVEMPWPTWNVQSSNCVAQPGSLTSGVNELRDNSLAGSAMPVEVAVPPQDQGSAHAAPLDGVHDERAASDLGPSSSSRDGDAISRLAQSRSDMHKPAADEHLPVRQLGAEEIAALLQRGRDFVHAFDFAAARLVFQRAAEGGDPQAALALGATYDPGSLEELGLGDVYSDATKARTWYEKARQLGSPRAVQRLKLLAGESR
jgi:hypothetical protein